MVNFSDLQLHDMEPVYVQIVRHLKRAIFLGEAAVGESLPSRRELAAQLCINPNTAQKAFLGHNHSQIVYCEFSRHSSLELAQLTAA